MKFYDAVVGGRSVGVPGTVRLIEAAHRKWGKLPWAEVFAPAIRLAEEGFTISPRLNGLLGQETYLAGNSAYAKAYFYQDDGNPKPVGTVLKNPDLAKTLRLLADKGADAFYTGEIAEEIVATVTGHPSNPGDITLDDLKGYKIEERGAVCAPYRRFTVCGMGPPSSGGIAVLQILSALESVDMPALKPGPEAAHWLSEAGRLAFADRALFVGDPAFVNVPVRGPDRSRLSQEQGRLDQREQVHRESEGRRPAVPEDFSLWPVRRRRIRHEPHFHRGPRWTTPSR